MGLVMENNTNYIGTLFNSINYSKDDDLNKFIEEMSNEQALYCLVKASEFAFTKGVFNLKETEVISKSIRLLTTPENNDE